jgi:hypothetical protein
VLPSRDHKGAAFFYVLLARRQGAFGAGQSGGFRRPILPKCPARPNYGQQRRIFLYRSNGLHVVRGLHHGLPC